MKTIASLTMIYLPSTFAASIFSTGFFSFDLQNGTEMVRVNPQIWKMFAIALGSSIVTIAVWIYLNKKGTPRILGLDEAVASAENKRLITCNYSAICGQ